MTQATKHSFDKARSVDGRRYDEILLALFELMLKDFLLPRQISYRAYRKGKGRGPMKRRTNHEVIAEARDWLFIDVPSEESYVFSFRMVCFYFGWNPSYMRRGIRMAKARARQGIRIEFNAIPMLPIKASRDED